MTHTMLRRVLLAVASGAALAGCIAEPALTEDADVPRPDGTPRFSEDAEIADGEAPDARVPDAEIADAEIPDARLPDVGPPPVYVCEADWAECYPQAIGTVCPDLSNGGDQQAVLESLGYEDDGCLWAYGPCTPPDDTPQCCYQVEFGCEGRPFFVEASLIVAAATPRQDWI